MLKKIILLVIYLALSFYSVASSTIVAVGYEFVYDFGATPEENAAAEAALAAAEADQIAHDLNCAEFGDCIDKASFVIETSNFSVGGKQITGDNAKEKINNTLGIIIQKLMVAMGILSLLIMTVGSGYMILYHGQDDLLSKGKTIFSSGLIALVVALSSYYLVSLVRFILYT